MHRGLSTNAHENKLYHFPARTWTKQEFGPELVYKRTCFLDEARTRTGACLLTRTKMNHPLPSKGLDEVRVWTCPCLENDMCLGRGKDLRRGLFSHAHVKTHLPHSKDLDETRVWNGADLETETRFGRGKYLHPSLSSNAHENKSSISQQGLGRSKGLNGALCSCVLWCMCVYDNACEPTI